MRFTERDVHGAQMFTALHRPQSEYDAPAPFAMPSYASVMGDFSHSASTYESKGPVTFL